MIDGCFHYDSKGTTRAVTSAYGGASSPNNISFSHASIVNYHPEEEAREFNRHKKINP